MAAHIYKRLYCSSLCMLTLLTEGPTGYFCFSWRLQAVRKFKCVEAHPRTDNLLKQRLATKLKALFGQTSSIRLCFCQTKPHTRNGFGVSFHFLEATKVLRLFKGLSITHLNHLQSESFFFWNMFSADGLDMPTKGERPRLSASLSVFPSSGHAPDTLGIAFQAVVWPLIGTGGSGRKRVSCS